MDPKVVAMISQKVYSRFPDMKGKKPKIAQSKTISSDSSNYVLTYKTIGKDVRGNKIPRQVRVVASEKGKIIKMSTSR